ncbi:enolase [Nitzschia inconspicua]|uniref:phosphopyruvate hydratase n=1 Tax=Nitzschia inconspicua TaxID=303405 RepID=A0A9K3KGA1_9STRA|nr:enolase [Nitzschia inconspicua]
MLTTFSRHVARKASTTGVRKMSAITGVKAREIIDSRGNPTVEVAISTASGVFTASVPSGASTGIYEACELRDGGKRYMGKGCLQAVKNANTVLADAVMGIDAADQRAIDDAMLKADGTPNKANLGANAILGISLAASKAGAGIQGIPLWKHYAQIAGNPVPETLPVPCFNVINGGEHAGNKLPFQEFFVIPTGAATFSESMEIGCEIFHNLKKVIKGKFGGDATLIGDEGGFAPPADVESGLAMIMEAAELAGYTDKISVGLDVASSEFKVAGKDAYDLDFKAAQKDPSQVLSGDEMIAFYKKLIDEYPIVTIEDPFDQDDWANWSKFTAAVGEKVQIVGDDLTVTNPLKIQEAINTKAANCLLLKVNQIGSISESIDAVKLSKQNGWGVMTSHRSGETEDNYIADLAVGLCTGQIKTGAPCRGERTAKYNQLLRIEEELGSAAKYPGIGFRATEWMG